jgi:cytochrome c-type biogenesis protein CcmF
MLLLAAGMGIVAAAIAFAVGLRHPIALAVTALTALAVAALLVPLVVPPLGGVLRGAPAKAGTTNLRRPLPRLTYSSSLIHLGFVCLVIGITGSSLGTVKHEAVMDEGETIQWAGRSIRLARVIQREDADRLIVEARVEVSRSSHTAFTVVPAQHLHRAHNEWTTEVAIHSTWAEDFYVIVHGGEAQSKVHLTFVVNPMMRWLWLGGWIAGVGALGALLSVRRRKSELSVVPAPHGAVLARSRVCEV